MKSKPVEAKLEFETFLKSLELIAEKVYPHASLSKALETLIVEYLLRLLSTVEYEDKVVGIHQIAKLKEIMSNEDFVEILGVVHENAVFYFNHYSDSKQHMNFNGFFKFFKDFDVFPRFTSVSKLQNYFFTLSSLNVIIL